jgi:hypothetical protein
LERSTILPRISMQVMALAIARAPEHLHVIATRSAVLGKTAYVYELGENGE